MAKSQDANPSVVCLPKKCDLTLPPELSTAFPATVPPCYKLHTTKSNRLTLATAKVRASPFLLLVHPDMSVPH